jgi:hypothetical protein
MLCVCILKSFCTSCFTCTLKSWFITVVWCLRRVWFVTVYIIKIKQVRRSLWFCSSWRCTANYFDNFVQLLRLLAQQLQPASAFLSNHAASNFRVLTVQIRHGVLFVINLQLWMVAVTASGTIAVSFNVFCNYFIRIGGKKKQKLLADFRPTIAAWFGYSTMFYWGGYSWNFIFFVFGLGVGVGSGHSLQHSKT